MTSASDVFEAAKVPAPATNKRPAGPWRNWAAFLAASVAAVAGGFWLVPEDVGLAAITRFGAWVMLATFIVFAWSTAVVIRRAWWPWWRDRREWGALATIPLGGMVLLRHEPFGFKIIMDEIMLLGTSMSLHLDKLVRVPLRGHDLQGAFVIAEGALDKRPYFFPFLVSLVHDVSGYRPENALVVNAVLTLVLLALVYALGRSLAGRGGAVAGVLLFVSLPLLGQNATGGGFDLLNLLMIALTFWLGLRFVTNRGGIELVALCYSAALLAQTRYESALFVAIVGALIVWLWWRGERFPLPAAVVALPLLLLPVAFMLRQYSGASNAWEMASQQTVTPMSLGYVAANLRHAVAFLFDWHGSQPNSLTFSCMGVVAWLVVLLRGRRIATRFPTGEWAAVVAFSLGLVIHLGLLLVYFWGRFDDPVIARLSLPVHLLLLIGVWLAIRQTPKANEWWRALTVLAVIQIWSLSIPKAAAHAYTLENVQAQEVAWRRELITARPARDFLVIDPYSIVWLTHQIPATVPAQVRAHPEAVAHHLRSRSFGDILVFQRFEVNGDTGELRVRPEYDVGEALVLETVAERRVQPYAVARLSRVVNVRSGDKP